MTKPSSKKREEIAAELTAAIRSCVEASGRTLTALCDDQCPLTAIKGFDSLCGIEVTVDLQARLGVHLEDNIFIESNGSRSRARTFDQIVGALGRAAA
jgi:hypothetical protein